VKVAAQCRLKALRVAWTAGGFGRAASHRRLRCRRLRTVTIQLQNEDHTQVVMTWKLLRARIVKHTSGPFNAKGSEVAMEEMVLAAERLEIE